LTLRVQEQRVVTRYSPLPTNNSYTRLDPEINLSLVLLQTEHMTNGDSTKESFVFNRTCMFCPRGQPGDEGLQSRSQGQTSSRQCRTVVLNSHNLFPLHRTFLALMQFQATHYMLLGRITTTAQINVTISITQLFQ